MVLDLRKEGGNVGNGRASLLPVPLNQPLKPRMLPQRIPHPVKLKGANTGIAWNLHQLFKDFQRFIMLTYNSINFSQVFQIPKPT